MNSWKIIPLKDNKDIISYFSESKKTEYNRMLVEIVRSEFNIRGKNLEHWIYDEENTSDEDSSDSDDDDFVRLNNNNKDQQEQINQNKNFFFRGFHLAKNLFKNTERREITKKAYHHKDIYSLALKEVGEKNKDDIKSADLAIRNNLSELKKDNDIYFKFIQDYKNSYGKLINTSRMTKEFNFQSEANPFISTSKESKPAGLYAVEKTKPMSVIINQSLEKVLACLSIENLVICKCTL